MMARKEVEVYFKAIFSKFKSDVKENFDSIKDDVNQVGKNANKTEGSFKGVTGEIGNATSAARSFSNVIKTLVLTKAATALISFGKDLTNEYGKTQTALGEMASIGYDDLELLRSAAIDFSNTWSGYTREEFISGAYAIKGGISDLTDEGVAKFTEMAALTAKATKETIDGMSNLFAQGYGIYADNFGTEFEFAESFGSGIAETINIFRSSGTEMSGYLSTLGAQASSAGAQLSEILTIGGQLQSVMSGSEAATQYQSFLKNAVGASKKLKLEFVGANGQLKSSADIIDLIKQKYGQVLDANEQYEISKAFGRVEATKFIAQLYNQTDLLREKELEIAEAIDGGTAAVDRMVQSMNSGLLEKTEIIKQRWANLKEQIGEQIESGISSALDEVSKGLVEIQETGDFTELGNNIGRLVSVISNELVSAFTNADGALSILSDGIGWLADNFTLVKDTVIFATQAMIAYKTSLAIIALIKGVAAAIKAYKDAQVATNIVVWAFNAALAANPIGAVIMIIAGLILIIVTLYRKCEWFRKGVQLGLNGLKIFFLSWIGIIIFEWNVLFKILDKFLGGIPLIGDAFGALADVTSKALGKINKEIDESKDNINDLINGVKKGTNDLDQAALKARTQNFPIMAATPLTDIPTVEEWRSAQDTSAKPTTYEKTEYFEDYEVSSASGEDDTKKKRTIDDDIDDIADKYDHKTDLYESRAALAEENKDTAGYKSNKQLAIDNLQEQVNELAVLENKSSGKNKNLVEIARNKLLKEISDITKDIKKSLNDMVGEFNAPSDVSTLTKYQYLLTTGKAAVSKLATTNNIEMNIQIESLGDLTETEAYNKLNMLARMAGLVMSKDSVVDEFIKDISRNTG